MTGLTLDEVYARIPDVACRGLCHSQCTIVPAGPGERARMAAAGHPIPTWQDGVLASMKAGRTLSCPALSAFGSCRAHQARPAICRMFGVAEGLPCEHGCTPERVLPEVEARALLAAADKARR